MFSFTSELISNATDLLKENEIGRPTFGVHLRNPASYNKFVRARIKKNKTYDKKNENGDIKAKFWPYNTLSAGIYKGVTKSATGREEKNAQKSHQRSVKIFDNM